MKLTAVYLEPQSGYKTPLRSDTLWGALCWGIRHVHGEDKLVEFIKAYKEGGDTYSLSSCFPYIEREGEKIHFFPRPKLHTPYKSFNAKTFDEGVKKMSGRKEKKKRSKYVSQAVFEKILQSGSLPDAYEMTDYPVAKAYPVTRNTINRIDGGTLDRDGQGQLFHVDEYHTNGGLFFLVKGKLDLLRGALNYLEHTGFGGDRSVGKGWFKIHYDENFELNEPSKANACTTLSLYHPKKQEIANFEADSENIFSYKLEMRGGRLGFLNYKQVNKDAILMFQEGSVFPIENYDEEQFGYNPIVLEPNEEYNPGLKHKVSHYGIGFMVKMNIPAKTNL